MSGRPRTQRGVLSARGDSANGTAPIAAAEEIESQPDITAAVAEAGDTAALHPAETARRRRGGRAARGNDAADEQFVQQEPATAAVETEVAQPTRSPAPTLGEPPATAFAWENLASQPHGVIDAAATAAELDEENAVEDEAELDDGTATGVAGRRRRRRGRGRRGRGGAGTQPGLEQEIVPADVAPPAVGSVEERLALPAYLVEFEPQPPPTKRRPARRPGQGGNGRFSRQELQEFEQFVSAEPPTRPPGSRAPTPDVDEFKVAPLSPEEARLLGQAQPQRRPRGQRGGTAGGEGGRAPAVSQAAAVEPVEGTYPAARSDAGSIEALLARQNVLLDTLMERQIVLLRNIERSLGALERRMGVTPQGYTSLPRVGVFVDVPNVIYAAERLGCNIDFSKLLAMLTRGRELVRATAYAPVSDDPQARLDLQKFVQPFVNRGYRIVTKPLKRFADGTMKGNFDVELAMDVLTMADRLDVVSLVSGDGDFSRLVDLVASKGVRIEVIAFSGSTSSELRASSDEYMDLGLYLGELCS